MNKIDWSKAPADATHYIAESDSIFECWLKPGYAVRVSRGTSDWVRSDYADGLIADCATARRSSPSWSGEGLPPVGVVCEVDWCEAWHKCEVIAHFQQCCGMVAVFTVDIGHGNKSLDAFGADCFRPIRTPEQIAAELADQAIKEIAGIICRDGAFDIDDPEVTESAVALYDAGYRKP